MTFELQDIAMEKQQTILYVENLKCGGCERTVHKILEGIDGVSNVSVSAEEGKVSFDRIDDNSILDKAVKFLTKAGYAPLGESDFRAKAMSYLSCMKGKLTD